MEFTTLQKQIMTSVAFISRRLQFACKMIAFFIILQLCSVPPIIMFLFRGRKTSNLRYLVMPFKFLSRWILGIECVYRGREQMQENEAFIILSNHQSSLDFIVLLGEYVPGTRLTVNKSLWYMGGLLGLAVYVSDGVFLDKANLEKAKESLNVVAKALKSRKIKLHLFPEGKRNADLTMVTFKKGPFHVAIQAQVPIYPVVASSYRHFYSRAERRFSSGRVYVTCLPKVSTEGMSSASDVEKLAGNIREMMQNAINIQTAELEKNINTHKD